MGMDKAVLFGASLRGIEVLSHVRDHYKVIGFVDNDKKKQGGTVAGIFVYAPEMISELNPDIVFVSSMYSPEIMHQLAHMGFPPDKIRNAGTNQMPILGDGLSVIPDEGLMKTATHPIRKILAHPDRSSKVVFRHAKTIAHALAGDYADAVEQLGGLLSDDPRDPLLHDTAARIYGILQSAAIELDSDILTLSDWCTFSLRWKQETDFPSPEEIVLVSVIVPVYNTEEYLAKCLDSLIGQTLSNIEIIVVNDESPDNAAAIIADYQRRYPHLIVALSKPNGGLSSARNHGTQFARGRYIGYVDSDDFIETNMYETLFDSAHLNRLQISIGQYFHYPPGGRITMGSALFFEDDRVYHGRDFLLQSKVMVVWNKLYEHTFIKRFSFPNTWFEDVAWTPVVMSYAERVGYVPMAFYHYIRREGSIASSHRDPRTLQGIDSVKHALTHCNPSERNAVVYMAVQRLLFESRIRSGYADKYLKAIKDMGPIASDNPYVTEDPELFSIVRSLSNGNPVIPKVLYYSQFGTSSATTVGASYTGSWTERLMFGDGQLYLLDEQSCDLKINSLVKAAYERGEFNLVGDYFRLKAICDNGGFTLSKNVKANHFIAPKLTSTAFFGYNDRNEIFDGVFGAIPGHEITMLALRKLEAYMTENDVPDNPLGRALSESLIELYGFTPDGEYFEYGGHTIVYPAEVFYLNLGNVGENASDPRCNITEFIPSEFAQKMENTEQCKIVPINALEQYVMRREDAVRHEMNKRITAMTDEIEYLNEIRRRPLWRVMNWIGEILGEIKYWRQTRALMRHDKDWAKRGQYANDLRSRSVDSSLVLLESFYGRGLLSSPYALFCAWLKRPDFNKYRFVWVLDDFSKHAEVIEDYSKRFNNVSFVQRDSSEYMRYLATAKYLINDVSFYFDYVKRDEQVYINTWHSITVKTLGFDIPGRPLDQKNVVRNFLACDYLLSPNTFMREKIFLESHRMKGLFPGHIMEEGHPRDDLSFAANRDEVLAEWKQAGVAVQGDRKIIMYAPTWRGASINTPSDNVDEYLELIRRIQYAVGDEYEVVMRVHQLVDAKLKKDETLKRLIVPAAIDANRCFAAVDLLITDYSSIYFDYLVTGNPVLFFIRDLEVYNEYRGVYFTPQELPGPAARDLEELLGYIQDISIVQEKYQSRYNETRAWACPYEDGMVSERVLAAVLDNRKNTRVFSGFDGPKTKILFYAGPLMDTPSTEMLFRILHRIQRDDFDISVLIDDRGSATTSKNSERLLNLGVRPIGRSEHTVFNAWERYCVDSTKRTKKLQVYQRAVVGRAMYTEWRRCLGQSTFDYIVNLDVESTFHAHLLLNGEAKKKIVWRYYDSNRRPASSAQFHLHNTYNRYDIAADDEYGIISALGARFAGCTVT